MNVIVVKKDLIVKHYTMTNIEEPKQNLMTVK